jgi:predicted AAA+ superfamily ATPase
VSDSISERTYKQRLLDGYLDELFAELPAVMLVGPRAVGKTTTAERRAATTVRLSVEAEAAAFRADPDAVLRTLTEPVLLDEWQAVPEALGAARRATDADPRAGRFLVTGSVRADLANDVWPTTGRFVRISVYPMTVREQLGRIPGRTFFDKVAAGEEPLVPSETPDLRGYVDLALRGGYPVPSLRLAGGAARSAWYDSYVQELLTHDVALVEEPVTRRRDSVRLRRYLEAYALNSAGVCPHRTIYEAAGVNRVTAIAYQQLLADLHVVDEIPAWQTNRLGRLVLEGKRYVVDSALHAALLRLDADGIMRDGDLLGRILDTFVVAQLRPEAVVSAARPRLYHLRTKAGRQEVDVVAELGGGRVIAVEIKASAAPSANDARHLAWLRERLGERFVAGFVLHTGPRLFTLGERVIAAPISVLWPD